MPNPIELRHLKNLTVVAEEGNISKAALRLFISQSSLSQQMKQLEESAQACLLVRHHGGVRATPAAEILIAGNKQITKLYNELLIAARSTNTAPFLPLRLGFSSFERARSCRRVAIQWISSACSKKERLTPH